MKLGFGEEHMRCYFLLTHYIANSGASSLRGHKGKDPVSLGGCGHPLMGRPSGSRCAVAVLWNLLPRGLLTSRFLDTDSQTWIPGSCLRPCCIGPGQNSLSEIMAGVSSPLETAQLGEASDGPLLSPTWHEPHVSRPQGTYLQPLSRELPPPNYTSNQWKRDLTDIQEN